MDERRFYIDGDRQMVAGPDEPPHEADPADPGLLAAQERMRGLMGPEPGLPLVCALCLFVGDSEDPRPVTIMNGNLTCEPHNGYFQGEGHVRAIIAWKREHPESG